MLGAETVSLLCSLLEAEEPVITGYAVELHPMAAASLIEHGLLVPAGYDDVIGVETDGQEELVSVFPIDDGSALGYLDRYAGFVAVPPERLLRRRVDVSEAFRYLAVLLDVPRSHTPAEIVEGLCWDLGSARFAERPQRHSVWFARRLWDAATRKSVQTMLERRPHIRPRLILTSSTSSAGEFVVPPDTLTISVLDALKSPSGKFRFMLRALLPVGGA
ncbi:hypothetical protein GCM10011320_55590 [Neoroseomonas lacus]|uniref:Uncharacterized protein n=1 Tax=Neoroseomonas lacus TaxID=287609 RepID=A0A917NYG4_9PROT|nr:hypothetical protein GCM10011320_55590 [Neoroseomonas lacus]